MLVSLCLCLNSDKEIYKAEKPVRQLSLVDSDEGMITDKGWVETSVQGTTEILQVMMTSGKMSLLDNLDQSVRGFQNSSFEFVLSGRQKANLKYRWLWPDLIGNVFLRHFNISLQSWKLKYASKDCTSVQQQVCAYIRLACTYLMGSLHQRTCWRGPQVRCLLQNHDGVSV